MILVPALLRRIGARAALTLMLSLTVALAIPLSSSPARAAVPPFCPGTIDTALLVACAAAPSLPTRSTRPLRRPWKRTSSSR